MIADDNDILIFNSDADTPTESLTARAIEVTEAFAMDSNMNASLWSKDGVECQCLRPNSPWKKVKVRIRIEILDDTDLVTENSNLIP